MDISLLTNFKTDANNNLANEHKLILDRLRIHIENQVLDFSILSEIIEFFIINKSIADKEKLTQIFIELFSSQVDESSNLYKNQNTKKNYNKLAHYTLVLMTIILNCRKLKYFIEPLFQESSILFKSLMKLILKTNKQEINKRVCKILLNLGSDEYKLIFYENQLQSLFKDISESLPNKISNSNIKQPRVIYKNMLLYLLNLNLDYNDFFRYKKFTEDDFPIIKTLFVQSIIRITFHSHKEKYLHENCKNYEFEFLQSIIDKCIKSYWDKSNGKITSLFRRDTLKDEILKNILFGLGTSFANKLYIEKLKNQLGLAENIKKDFYLEDMFFKDFNKFLSDLTELMPLMIRLILRMIHCSIINYFSIEKNNYRPLFTFLFFNFLFSPKLQEIFKLSPTKSKSVMNINRIIRNISFNTLFMIDDTLSRYNELIPDFHLKLTSAFDKVFHSIDIFDEKIIGGLMRQYLTFPKFLFYYDSEIVLEFLKDSDDFDQQYSQKSMIQLKHSSKKEFDIRKSFLIRDLNKLEISTHKQHVVNKNK